MSTIVRTFLSAVLAYSTHYGVTKLYSEFCIPSGVYGFFQGGLTAGSPICSTALTFMTSTHNAYSAIILASLSRMFVDFAIETSDKITTRVEKRLASVTGDATVDEEASDAEN